MKYRQGRGDTGKLAPHQFKHYWLMIRLPPPLSMNYGLFYTTYLKS